MKVGKWSQQRWRWCAIPYHIHIYKIIYVECLACIGYLLFSGWRPSIQLYILLFCVCAYSERDCVLNALSFKHHTINKKCVFESGIDCVMCIIACGHITFYDYHRRQVFASGHSINVYILSMSIGLLAPYVQ